MRARGWALRDEGASEQATPCRNRQRHTVNKYSTHTDGMHDVKAGSRQSATGVFFSFSFFRIEFIVTSGAIDIHIHNTYVNAYLTSMRTLVPMLNFTFWRCRWGLQELDGWFHQQFHYIGLYTCCSEQSMQNIKSVLGVAASIVTLGTTQAHQQM